jgi:site-specific recombinase XerD
MPYRSFRSVFKRAARKAEVKDFTFHDLRHTFASRVGMAGVDLPTVKELLGHRDLSMTMRYIHLSSLQ